MIMIFIKHCIFLYPVLLTTAYILKVTGEFEEKKFIQRYYNLTVYKYMNTYDYEWLPFFSSCCTVCFSGCFTQSSVTISCSCWLLLLKKRRRVFCFNFYFFIRLVSLNIGFGDKMETKKDLLLVIVDIIQCYTPDHNDVTYY